MDETKLLEFKDDFALFIEAGFIAVKQLDETSALRIFDAAAALNPDHSAPKIGIGYVHLNKLEVKQATAIFTEVTEKEPTNWLAQTFLGICFLLTKPKRKKGETLIQEAIKNSEDPTIKKLGAIALEWAEKDLYKKGAPFFGNKEQETVE